jgi:hypothetical protein
MTIHHLHPFEKTKLFDMKSKDRKTLDNILVQPELASYWLETANTKNRTFKPLAITQYANDMKAGNWTPSRIIFYHDGVLCDGQNRLAAAVKAGIPVLFDILVGASYEEGVNVDMGVKRKQRDSLKMQGVENWIADTRTIGMINFLIRLSSGNKAKLSHNEIKQYAENNQKWIKPIAELTIKKKNLTTSGFFASAALALRAEEPLDEVLEFCHAYATGEVFDRNKNAVVKLREYCLENTHCWTGGHNYDTAKRAQRAIKAYINNEPLQKLYAPTNWIYPFPAFAN